MIRGESRVIYLKLNTEAHLAKNNTHLFMYTLRTVKQAFLYNYIALMLFFPENRLRKRRELDCK